MFGAAVFGVLIDLKRYGRRNRARASLAFLFVFHMAIWGASYHKQRGYYRTPDGASVPRIDVTDSSYGGFAALYFFQGVLDAVTQNWAYWCVLILSFLPACSARGDSDSPLQAHGRHLELARPARSPRRPLQGHPVGRCVPASSLIVFDAFCARIGPN